MPKVVQNGLGKMGTAALRRLLDSGIEVVGVADPHPSIEDGYKLARSSKIPVKDDITQISIEPGTILVDFSSPDACLNAARYVAKEGGKLVIGTTPLPKEYETEILSLGNNSVVILSPIFSLEANRFFKQLEYVGKTSDKDAWVSIHERHRAEKLTTSGTAAKMARILCETMNKDGYILLREGKAYNPIGNEMEMPKLKELPPNTLKKYIQVSCERFGDEPGLHVVRIGDEIDYSEYSVRATRNSNAKGVEMAVCYASTKEKGVYDFSKDVLGL
ncbi:MAG: dihydrodipicolinate reductase C-terminal domain-containing protein [Candidatus Aenigmarchaeota archaeon]|nr:dihydrodipicolinate reductase C-terminal domain-containing protein [Candidatus Aenigmarchaeota archaeon]